MKRFRNALQMVAASILICAGSQLSALADSNVLEIVQKGSDNSLNVDQSAASNSSVNGLALDRSWDTVETISFERLSAVQNSGSPAIQQGSGNSASITIEGNGGQVGLLQSNPITGTGHTAYIKAFGGGSALVGQLGNGNIANLTVDGGNSAILQEGYSNQATLSVGSGSAGLIGQIGNSNVTSLEVPAGGANVSYLVYGNGLIGSVPATVISNSPGTVVIRQYQTGFAGMPGSGS